MDYFKNISKVMKNEESFAGIKKILPNIKEMELNQFLVSYRNMYSESILPYPGDFTFYESLYKNLAKGLNLYKAIVVTKKELEADFKLKNLNVQLFGHLTFR